MCFNWTAFQLLRTMRFHALIFICLALFTANKNIGQTVFPRSYLGKVHTPRGHLHVLWIFVRYDNKNLFNNPKWLDDSGRDALPVMANGFPNHLFNTTPESIGQVGQRKNLSDFFYKMSNGEFLLTGDVFPVQVPITYIPEVRGNFSTRGQRMNQAAIDWIAENYPDFDWSKYDNRKNNSNFKINNIESEPDGILDYVVFMHRAPGLEGVGSPGRLRVPNTDYLIRDGHTGLKSFAETEQNWQFFLHEFAHNLYNSPHYAGANGSDGLRYYTQKGWGLMSFGTTSFSTMNAWESWWLGWLEPKQVVRSGIYELKDFVTEYDAIRIPIPGTYDYVWLENHQKKDPWDDKVFYNSEEKGYPSSAPGIYMYTVGRQGSNRDNARLNPLQARDANLIKFFNAEGNFDYEPSGDSIDTEFFRAIAFEKVEKNPFSGQNDFQYIRYDFNGNERIEVGFLHGNRDSGGKEQKDIWATAQNNQLSLTVDHSGNEDDAFVLGDEIGLSGIIPVTHFPLYNRKQQELEAYVINGITIKILERDSLGTYRLDIQLDDWNVRKDSRWCGNLLIAEEVNIPDSMLHIKSDVVLRLDHSRTPDRLTPHPITGNFTNPTKLVVESGRGIMLERGSELIIDNYSQLILQAGAKLVIEKGAKLTIRNEGELIMGGDSELSVMKRGKFERKESGRVDIPEEATLNFAKKSKVRGI